MHLSSLVYLDKITFVNTTILRSGQQAGYYAETTVLSPGGIPKRVEHCIIGTYLNASELNFCSLFEINFYIIDFWVFNMRERPKAFPVLINRLKMFEVTHPHQFFVVV